MAGRVEILPSFIVVIDEYFAFAHCALRKDEHSRFSIDLAAHRFDILNGFLAALLRIVDPVEETSGVGVRVGHDDQALSGLALATEQLHDRVIRIVLGLRARAHLAQVLSDKSQLWHVTGRFNVEALAFIVTKDQRR